MKKKLIKAVMSLFIGSLFSITCAQAVSVVDTQVWSVNGHTYYLLAGNDTTTGGLTGLTWSAAEAYAVNILGGHLAAVDSLAAQEWIWNSFGTGKGAGEHLWIGLTDKQTEGTYQWIASGTTNTTYWNWYPGEPNNYGNEDYVMMLSTTFSGGNSFGPGQWNDYVDSSFFYTDSIYAIAETTGHTSPVPEPTTMLLFGTGIAGLVAVARRKNKA